MTYEEYVAAQRMIVLEATIELAAILNPLRAGAIAAGAWVGLVARLFELVLAARRASAELAREFYDHERNEKLGGRHPIYLAEYKPEWLYEALEPARETFSRSGASEEAMSHVIGIALKEVENAGRSTIRRGIESEPGWRNQRVGWARVEGGGESCAFCLMLISRGPVYLSARTAGLNTDDVTAKQLIESGNEEKLNELMTRWHPNCDCKTVPVFDQQSWPGRDNFLFAERIWKNAEGSNSEEKLRWIRRFLDERDRQREQDSPGRIAA